MSSEDKDPMPKQDTTSESSESHSDSEINKAEENLEHLKIEERLVKEQVKESSEESKPLDSPNQEGTVTSQYGRDPTAGPSGLQKPRLVRSDSSSDPETENVVFSSPRKRKGAEVKDAREKIGARLMEADSDSIPTYSPSSTPASFAKNKSPSARGRRRHRKSETADQNLCYEEILRTYFGKLQQSSSSRRVAYAADSANTSSDFSEMPSEVGDSSATGSVYQDAQETFEKDQTPSYKSALERQSSDSSNTNISEILDENFVLTQTSSISSASISSPSGEGGNRDFIAQCQREADERGEPISSSSGIGSTNQSEFANLQQWGLAGEMGFRRRGASDSQKEDDKEQDEEPHSTSEPIEHQPIIGQQRSPRYFATLIRRDEHTGEILVPPNEDSERSPRRSVTLTFRNEHSENIVPRHDDSELSGGRKQKVEKALIVSIVEAGASSNRRQPQCSSGSSSAEKGVSGHLRHKPHSGKKSKVVPSKLNDPLKSNSESPEPKSTSSDESRRRESPEIKSSSESSRVEVARKPWQKPGILRSMQRTTSPLESIITEEEECRISPSNENPELMETKDKSPQKMSSSEGAEAELSESKPSILETSSQVFTSDTEGILTNQELSFEVPEYERKAGKSKRANAKLSNSPPSEEKLDSSPLKSATSGPSEKSKSGKQPEKKRKTKQDGTDAFLSSRSLDSLIKDECSSSNESDDDSPNAKTANF